MIADYQTPARMNAKMAAVPLPYMLGKNVLDVGCDFGFWTFLAASKGASQVLGLDRNRDVRGVGRVDLVEMNRRRATDEGRDNVRFEEINLGKQWREFGQFDIVLCLSVYHHIYEGSGGDHAPIWFWLSRHCVGQVLWEGPVDDSDPVVRANVSDAYRPGYNREAILEAASRHFEAEYIGPALHEPTRQVWRFTPKPKTEWTQDAHICAGAGGATKAFEYADGRRIKEIEDILGVRPIAGSLNLHTYEKSFDWDLGYYRAQVLDVKDRSAGIGSEWAPRWARFYPVNIEGIQAWAFRFEGERYPETFLELLAPTRLRDGLPELDVMLTR